MTEPSTPLFTVPVRKLVEFTLRRGGLGGDGTFLGPRRALQGLRGHQRVQRSRPSGYQKEVPLCHDVARDDLRLRIQGRLDGLLTGPDAVLIEEIKTIQGAWDGHPDALHWGQARLYGYIYAQANARESLDLQLTYLQIETGAVTEFREHQTRAELTAFCEPLIAIYVEWLQERVRWCRERDTSIRALAFPFASYRPGQRALAVAAYRAIARGQRLFVEAPTGIGKTVSVLFPAVKALADGKAERIFYLTARTVGRAIAEKACNDLRRGGLRLRTVTLTAKDKVCVREGQPCDPAACPLALGYYDRNHGAIRAALAREAVTRHALESIGREHQVCPFELALDVSEWADAVVCDYNHVFDPQAYLRRHFAEDAAAHVLLVDEAHNLVDRAREMFSAELDTRELREVKRAMGRSWPRCGRALSRLATACRKLARGTPAEDEGQDGASAECEPDLFASSPDRAPTPAGVPGSETTAAGVPLESREGVRAYRDCPSGLTPLVDAAIEQAELWLARNDPAPFRDHLFELYFRLTTFRRTLDTYDDRFRTLVASEPGVRLRLFCLDPSALLREALARSRSAVFFSATLAPADYYRTLLGGAPEDRTLRLPSPFAPAHLAVLVHDRIHTTLKARGSTIEEVVRALGAVVLGRGGNYLVYLPSYQYLRDVQERFQAAFPGIPVQAQRPGMSEPERESFLAAFASGGDGTLIGFAVLGGVFGEGIDLVGEHLIGAMVVGVGLPQLCCERDLIRRHFEEHAGAGFDYAYLFPGMNRVLQAVGRVIRSETDRGVVLLIDARFAEARFRRLFPPEWRPVRVRSGDDIRSAVERFWQPPAS